MAANDTYIDPSLIPDYTSFLPQSYANQNLPTSGGPRQTPPNGGITGNQAGNIGLDVFSMSPINEIFGGLFGGNSAPSFQPYLNAQGQYVWADPAQRNPVPVSQVPGASLNPKNNKNLTQTANNVQAISDLLPYLSQAINGTIAPNAIAQLQASQLTSPGYAQMMTNLYNQYGPALNQIGNQIQNQNALAQANTTNDVLNGPGQQTVQSALAMQKQVDPQYFQMLQQAMGQYGNLFNAANNQIQGQLTPTEMNQIQQGINRNAALNGTLGAPSSANTIANAMNYGTAGTARQQQGISNLSQALSSVNGFLPMSKSGIDAFQVATGRSSQANPGQSNMGNSLFPGTSNTAGNGSNAYGLAGQMFGGLNSMTAQSNAQSFQRAMNSFGNQFTSNLGASLGQSTGNMPSQMLTGLMMGA